MVRRSWNVYRVVAGTWRNDLTFLACFPTSSEEGRKWLGLGSDDIKGSSWVPVLASWHFSPGFNICLEDTYCQTTSRTSRGRRRYILWNTLLHYVISDMFSGRLSFNKIRLALISFHIISSITFTRRCNQSLSSSNPNLSLHANTPLPYSSHIYGFWENDGRLPAQPLFSWVYNQLILTLLPTQTCFLPPFFWVTIMVSFY